METISLLKLRKILLFKTPYYILLGITLVLTFLRLQDHSSSHYQEGAVILSGTVAAYQTEGDQLSLELRVGQESMRGYYIFQKKEEKQTCTLALGDTIKVKGSLKEIQQRNQKDQMKKCFFTLQIETYQITKRNQNIIQKTRQLLRNHLEQFSSKAYLKTFLMGDKSSFSKTLQKTYQEIGVSHLFALSGMHISFLSALLLKILKKWNVREGNRYKITTCFLLGYLALTGISPSMLRAVLFFLLFACNRYFYFYIKSFHLFLVTLCLTLWWQPYYLFDIGFQFSFLISGCLLLGSEFLARGKTYFGKALRVSFLSFCASLPILANHFYVGNVGSIFYNLLYVPIVSYVLFPASFVVTLFPFLDPIYYVLLQCFEKGSLFLSSFQYFEFGIPSLEGIWFCFFVLFILFISYVLSRRPRLLFLYLFLFGIHLFYPIRFFEHSLLMIDVGQGDSILLVSSGKAALIDTGGVMHYSKESWAYRESYSIATEKIIPLLRSKGIQKLEFLFLSHGDFDHMGEAEELIQNFKVQKVLFNEGNKNTNERRLEHLLKKNQISYGTAKEGSQYELGEITLFSLNHDLGEENDSSTVLLGTFREMTFLLMGDSSIRTEESLQKNYNFPSIDLLKVGHHGSKTSTSEKFLKEIRPKLALISCGESNKFGHPHEEVLERFRKFQVPYLRTDREGNISIDLIKKEVMK